MPHGVIPYCGIEAIGVYDPLAVYLLAAWGDTLLRYWSMATNDVFRIQTGGPHGVIPYCGIEAFAHHRHLTGRLKPHGVIPYCGIEACKHYLYKYSHDMPHGVIPCCGIETLHGLSNRLCLWSRMGWYPIAVLKHINSANLSFGCNAAKWVTLLRYWNSTAVQCRKIMR